MVQLNHLALLINTQLFNVRCMRSILYEEINNYKIMLKNMSYFNLKNQSVLDDNNQITCSFTDKQITFIITCTIALINKTATEHKATNYIKSRPSHVPMPIPGGPIKTEQSIQSIFQDFALINSYLFSPCWIEHLFLIIITPRSSNLVENFLFYE